MARFVIADYDHESVTVRVTGIYEGCKVSVWIFEADNPDSVYVINNDVSTGSRITITTYDLKPKTDYIIWR